MSENLLIKILQTIEYNLALESNLAVEVDAESMKAERGKVANKFYERYYMYKKDIQQLQEEYAKAHYT